MEEVHVRLAGKLTDCCGPGPAVVVGMAETAVGLGQGIYEQLLARTGRDDLLFLHTTRYRLERPVALHFEESHSHATEHLLYEPAEPGDARLFREAQALVLVDDEISTGRTLVNLARAYRRLNGALRSVHLVSITEWLGARRRAEVADSVGLPTSFHSLHRGSFAFEADPDFDPGPIPDVVGRGDRKDAYLRGNFGRLGLRARLELDWSGPAAALGLRPGGRLLVLGTGEFMHAPFRWARHLEEVGYDVHFQSTTRSPLLPGEDLASVVENVDNYHDGIPNYLYNVADRHYDHIVLCYETWPLPEAHRLPELLNARTLRF
jgi:hypothetical protein